LGDRWNVAFGTKADFAVCVHIGPAAIGTLGTASARSLTAAGPAVEAARRLRAAAATNGARMVVSVEVLPRSGVDPNVLERLDLQEMAGAKGVRVAALVSLQHLSLPPGL
jgi:class 3 adenylate cyclase